MKKVSFQEFNLAPSGHAWLLELEIEGVVMASLLLQQESPPGMKQCREFRESLGLPHLVGGVVNFYPVLLE